VGNIQGISFASSNNTVGFSVEAGVNGPNAQASGAGIVTKGTGSGGEQFNLDVYQNKFRFFVRDSKGATPPGGTLSAPSGPTNGVWQHVVGVYDGSSSGYLYLYVNGQQVAATAATTNGILSSTNPVSLGSRQSGTGAYDDNFSGSLDEVAIYNYALNGSQVYNHYQAQYIWNGFPPRIGQQPQSVTVYDGEPSASFSVFVGGDPTWTYQWVFDGTGNIAGANNSTYTLYNIAPSNAGTYSCAVTNNFGSTNSAAATLTVLSTNGYAGVILGDNPISFWRLAETNGSVAYDYWGGNNGQYTNVTLGLPGYAGTNGDACAAFAANANGSYVQVTNATPFNFAGFAAFSLEAWVNFTNLIGVQRVFSDADSTGDYGYGFGPNGANELRFTAFAAADYDLTLPAPLVPGKWYHLVLASDGGNFYYYVNGQLAGTVAFTYAIKTSSMPLIFGRHSSSPGDLTPEQLNGFINDVAVYNSTLNAAQVLAHYNAGTGGPPKASAIVSPPTNYVGLSVSLQALSPGANLTYQWFHDATLLTDQTNEVYEISSVQLADGGSYTVKISNPLGTNTSPAVALTVLPDPTNALMLNLTSNLVLHLPFDNDYNDYSGRGNNGTPVGSPSFVSPGAVGPYGLSYSTTVPSSYNYVNLGVPADFQFGSNVDFSVSYWVQQPSGSLNYDLPFISDAVASLGYPGFTFAPAIAGGAGTGGWAWSLVAPGDGNVTSAGAANSINDGNWHHLVHTFSRGSTGIGITYLDGIQVDSQSIAQVRDIDTGYNVNIGQDATGSYAVTGSAFIDDVGIWRRALSPLEVSGIYVAGVSNRVSFAEPEVRLSVQRLANGQVQIAWPVGTLQSAPSATGPFRDVSGATSPWPVALTPAQTFFRIRVPVQ
jgi:hypothetical protein